VLVLSLIPLLLLPGACHAHAGISDHDPSGKDRSPHFHLRFFLGMWKQSGEDRPPSSHVGRNPFTTFDRNSPASDHDEDAVYLPLPLLLGWSAGPQINLVDPSTLIALAPEAGDTHAISLSARAAVLSSASQPDKAPPIRLRLLPLLI
jgi:hypothetical protein